ncbi:hypothetical protein ACEPAG_1927 [Sanghuangporus baumii]
MSSASPPNAGYSRSQQGLSPSSSSTPRRPASIQELAQRAEIKWDASRDFKYWLKVAEKARHLGQDYDLHGDLEKAFVEYARAATLILDKIPTHRDYHTRLTQIQRETLISKGRGVLDRMGALKPPLIDRHNTWENAQHTPRNHQASPSAYDSERRPRDWDRNKDQPPFRKPSIVVNGHSRDERDSQQMRYPDTEQERPSQRGDEMYSPVQSLRASQKTRADQEANLQRLREVDGEAWTVRKAALQQQYNANNGVSVNPSGFVSIPIAPPLAHQRSAGQSSTHSASDSTSTIDTPPLLPLESPARRYDEDLTDPETEGGNDEQLYRRVAELSMGSSRGRDTSPSSSSALINPFGGPGPLPITTTSNPPPNISAVSYPQLMTQHQRTQGYIPANQALLVYIPPINHQSSPMPDTSTSPQPKNLYQNILPPTSQPVPGLEREREYAQHNRERDRAYMYGPREAPPHSHSRSHSASPHPSVPQRPYEMPQPQPSPYSHQTQVNLTIPTATGLPPPRASPARSPAPSATPAPPSAPVPGVQELRTVSFPRAVLPRFLAIAAVNTAKNRETCGLLLGKPKSGSKLIVTTLLIPKQHSTSDTCNMDEEELVLEFTEKRGLIILGWIHTHPTQSCFMSSVDLHTHSGFQCMLPESFAVVCAPQHSPNFGIFRLTDPPGLQTILECDQKSAFHPHPELPIYTDADKGHVQMRDLPLEIVDLR